MPIYQDQPEKAKWMSHTRCEGCIVNSNAVSDLIAVVLLLGVLVVGVGIIMVTMTSQPLPDEIPNINILVGNTTTAILIKHNGGDPLGENVFKVVVDGTALQNQGATITGGDGAWPWSVGETLQYPVAAVPHRVSILYTAGGGSALLKSASLDGEVRTGGPDTPEGPGTTPPTGNITLAFDDQDELDEFVIEEYVKQLEGDSILLSRGERGSSGSISGTISFTIAEPGSYLVIGTTKVPLYVGDDVAITITPANGDRTHVQIFMIGDKGWSIKMIKNGPTIVISNTSTTVPSGELKESWIRSLTNFQSTLEMRVGVQKHWTRLLIDGNMLIDSLDTRLITCTGIKPSNPTLWIIDFPAQQNDPVIYMGKATSVQAGATTVYSES